jgi:Protein of unknown function (DUF3040)
MPLSEHEQKILAELEESLSKQDPKFAKSVRETNVYSHSLRRVRWAILTFLLGLVVLVAFVQSVMVGIVGVAMMFVSAVVIERNIRRIGRASWRDLTRRTTADDASAVGGPLRGLRDVLNKFRSRP